MNPVNILYIFLYFHKLPNGFIDDPKRHLMTEPLSHSMLWPAGYFSFLSWCTVSVCICLGVCLCVCRGPDLGPVAAFCMSVCRSDSHHCSRSASASPLTACSHHHQNNAERWRVSSASTPDITQRQRRRNSTPVTTHRSTVNVGYFSNYYLIIINVLTRIRSQFSYTLKK